MVAHISDFHKSKLSFVSSISSEKLYLIYFISSACDSRNPFCFEASLQLPLNQVCLIYWAILQLMQPLPEKCPNTEFFQSEYRKTRTRKNSVFGHFSHSASNCKKKGGHVVKVSCEKLYDVIFSVPKRSRSWMFTFPISCKKIIYRSC